jgi:FkbM family methyltransferase
VKTDLSRLPVLSALLDRAGLQFVDVGGRGSGLKNLLSLAPYAHYFVSEPDAGEARRLAEALPAERRWRGVTVFSDAVASAPGEARLHITREPGMSSLLEPDAELTRRFFQSRNYEVERVERVRTITLDDAAERHGFTDACFLKLDTQGTELDILRSGARLLAGPVLGLYTEANFQPFYQGQAVFANLDEHLRAQGFSLFGLNRTGLRRTGYRPDGYSKRVITWAHCLYLREPDTLLRRGSDHARRDLPRLLGLAQAFQFYDLAFEIVDVCRTVGVLPPAEQETLLREVSDLNRHVTNRVVRDATGADAVDMKAALLSPTMRDKEHPDRS